LQGPNCLYRPNGIECFPDANVLRESECNRRTGCGKTARPGLCGGRRVTGVPTAREFLMALRENSFMNLLKTIGKIGGIWFAAFSGIWVILQPLGGMTVLQKIGNQTIFLYIIILIITFLLSITFYTVLIKRIYVVKNDPVEMNISRTKYNYMDLLTESEKIINLLGLSLPTFSLESKIEFLRAKIREGLRIRIILLNPFSPATKQRPDRIYDVATNVPETCINTLTVLLKLQRKGITDDERKNFEIRLINIHPCIGVIGNETKLFWSPYLALYSGAKSPYLIHDLRKSKFGNEIQKHFDELWENYSISINISASGEDLKRFAKKEGFEPNNLEKDLLNKLEKALGDNIP